MAQKIKPLRSSVAGARPVSTQAKSGEIYINFADLQLGIMNTDDNAQDLLSIRFYSDKAKYNINDVIVELGKIYRCTTAITTPESFDPTKWELVTEQTLQQVTDNGNITTNDIIIGDTNKNVSLSSSTNSSILFHDGSVDGKLELDSTLSKFIIDKGLRGTNDVVPTDDKDYVQRKFVNDGLATKEDDLGSPSSNGQLLSSGTDGTRSWVDAPTLDLTQHSVTELNDVTDAGSGEIITSTERTKLSNIEDGAEVNVQSDWSETDTNVDSYILNKPTDITDLSTHSVTELNDVTNAGSGEIITSTERTKLSNIEDGAEVNVQSDWNETDTNSDSYILNKPTDITDLSSHSVTELNDVTDAGSGMIITASERTKLQNAMERIINTTQYDFVNFSDTNGGIADLGISLNDSGTSSLTLWSAEKINNELNTKEDDLGSPINNGQVLSSDTNGSRSWTTIPSAPVDSVFGRTGAVTAQNGDYTATQITNTPSGNISSTDVQAAITELDSSKLETSLKGANDGLAELDTNGKVPMSQLPDAVTGAVYYKGTWDASGGTYPANPNQGDYYIISVAGTINSVDYNIGDWTVYNGTDWDKIDNTDKVVSVNGKIGVVVLDPDDLDDTSTTNKFVTQTDITNWNNKLDSVTSDTTLSGDGTSSSPLSVDIVIDDLNDVDTTTNAPTNNQILQWDGTNWIPANLPTQTTPTLDDVTGQGSSSSTVMSYTGTPTFSNDLDIPDKKYVDDKTLPLAGDAANRPSGTVPAGTMYYAVDLGYPIWYDPNNAYWVNASGSYVLPGI